jgi:Flp pilus assembly protein TadG
MAAQRRNRTRQKGIALVETVIVTPVLLFLIMLTAEITNAFVDHNTLTKYARNGARFLSTKSLSGTTGTVLLTAQLISDTRNLVVYGNPAGTGSPVLAGLAPGSVQVLDIGGRNIQVTVTYPYTGILGGTLPSFGFGADNSLNLTLRATVVMPAIL